MDINDGYDADDEKKDDESVLMPPPPIPVKDEHNVNQSYGTSSDDGDQNKRKLETPLAAMLPSKYADVDVTELFPDFRHGKVLDCFLFLVKPNETSFILRY